MNKVLNVAAVAEAAMGVALLVVPRWSDDCFSVQN
jgi:hypothetical protein